MQSLSSKQTLTFLTLWTDLSTKSCILLRELCEEKRPIVVLVQRAYAHWQTQVSTSSRPLLGEWFNRGHDTGGGEWEKPKRLIRQWRICFSQLPRITTPSYKLLYKRKAYCPQKLGEKHEQFQCTIIYKHIIGPPNAHCKVNVVDKKFLGDIISWSELILQSLSVLKSIFCFGDLLPCTYISLSCLEFIRSHRKINCSAW